MQRIALATVRRMWATLILGGLVAGVPMVAHAGGISLYEIGTADVALASAGWAARAQDPSTLFKNPAGMSLLEGNQFQLGTQLLYGSVGFSPSAGTTVSGSDGGNPVGVFPGGGAYYVRSVGKDIRLGFGVVGNFGLSAKYDGDWVGRYYLKDSTLLGTNFVPAASYRVNDWISIGGALNVMVGYFKYTSAVNNALPGLGDGQVQAQDMAVGVGGNVGVLLQPKSGTRFGITYSSPIKLNFSTTPTFSGLGPGLSTALSATGALTSRLDLGMTVPQQVMVSTYHEVTDRLAMMADFGWQDWSQFGKVDVAVVSSTTTTLTTPTTYQDTYHMAVGGRYRLNPAWLINTGFAYDTSMVKDQDRTLSLAIGKTYRFGIGAEWQMSPSTNLAFSYELAYSGDLPVDQNRGPLAGRVVGEYPGSYLNFFAVSVIWGPEKG